ncbi:MAG: glutathione S-transferase N-terminal domain-containing protein [Zoogloeaceae bacterium]|nr:glutathione S-transferase N-terminal domain-containing protein [Zoogloeaceae bacterium]
MKLIGMLDSPYVRRVAISLQRMGIAHGHESVSVFRHFEAFSAINPLVKAPTLICDDGGILMDSQLILDYAEALVTPEQRLVPATPEARLAVLRLTGIALVVCEKAVQRYYELQLRPQDKQHQPWIERVTGQLTRALDMLEPAAARVAGSSDQWLTGPALTQADITTAVAWRFARHIGPDAFDPTPYPALAALSARAEALPEFLSTPLE